MCGRYTLTSIEGLVEELGLAQPPPALAPRYNIAPSDAVWVVDNRPRAQRQLTSMRWGLVPYWAKDPAIGHKLINARRETLARKPAFKSALQRRRCLIIADGFYEWKREGKVRKPFYIRPAAGGLLAFAGLWESWRAPDGQRLRSCTIITTEADQTLAAIHHRMPVIVARDEQERWLDPELVSPRVLEDLLAATAAQRLALHEVSSLVNAPQNDVPGCIEPAPGQPSLFHRLV